MSFDVAIKRAEQKRPRRLLGASYTPNRLPRTIRVSLTIGRSERDEVGYLSAVELVIGDDLVKLELQGPTIKSLKINSDEISPESGQFWYAPLEGLVPNIHFFSEQQGDAGKYYAPDSGVAVNKIVKKLLTIAHGNTSKEKLQIVARQLQYTHGTDFMEQFSALPSVPDSLRSRLRGYKSSSAYAQALRSLALFASLPAILQEVGRGLETAAQGVRYIEPLRATAERYYRLQDLAVDEIDSSGANTAMFLHSLDDYELDMLQKWMGNHLGFEVYPERSTGHVAVKIREPGKRQGRNIADLGFGYSQVIPIALQLWHCCIRGISPTSNPTALLAIEQPELHLHPSYQSLLADLFVAVGNSLKQEDSTRPIIIETHSEHIVNRLGWLVGSGVADKSDIQILLFEQEAGETVVRQVEFDAEGVLPDSWPLGFFLPEA